ncbi:universal stress protein [Spirosoma terrae]|uniref:Universal stress protein n=1 Tax=Spirosoma terrae TaxID=1968276 RepID=A0A6L9L828_9BACT|nr:universal stress protein [Spirosoma terrae]NDU96796.1 universal stress protein [Spirosoma terrae]
MSTLKRILVPVEYSEKSEAAVLVAAAMSRRHKAVLRLLHVINPDTYSFSGSDKLVVSMSTEDVILSELSKLQRWADSLLQGQSVQCYVECRIGIVHDRILEKAQEVGADLIVMGSEERSGMRDYLLGSDTYRVLKEAPCPVLTVPGNTQATDFKQILFSLRPVEGALDSYEFARRIIQKNKAHVTILALFDNRQAETTTLLTQAIRQLDKRLKADSIKADMLVTETDSVSDTLLQKSADLQTSLIILMASPELSFTNFFKGAVARQVIRRARVPVLSMRPHQSVDRPILPIRGGIKSMQRIFSLVQAS